MKPRSYSAQKASQPSTSNPKNRYERVQTSYNSLKKNQSLFGSKKHDSFAKKNKVQFRSLTKPPQQIIEQNLNLKSFINNLQEQLVLQRSRLQVTKKKNLKFTKQLNRQFQKEMYYSGKNPNGYMISGVKQQYQNIKLMYEDKCIEMQTLYRSLENTQIQELKTHIQALQQQNILLRTTLQTYMNIKEQYQNRYEKPHPSLSNLRQYKENGRLYSQPSEDKQSEISYKNDEVLAYILAEQKDNHKRSLEKIYYQNQRIEMMTKRQSQLVKKITFLQKLLIQKDNNQHSARRQLKKIEKERIELQHQIVRMNELLQSTQIRYTQKLKNLQQKQKKKFEVQKQIFMTSLNEKTNQIAKLEKEIRFLATMLSYWKPLDEINREFKRQSQKENSQSEVRKQGKSIEKDDKLSNSNRFRVNSEQAHESHFLDVDYLPRPNHQTEKSLRVNKEDQSIFKRTITDNRSSQNALISVREKIERPRRDCSKKHSEKSKKVRKVDLNQIRSTGQLMRFKLLGYQIDIQKVKSFFSQKNSSLTGQEQSLETYITMKEIQTILLQFPFQLKEKQAILVSRYIVEDSYNEYVYWDEDNQMDRNVAKSILKAFIGDYTLPNKQDIKRQWQKIKKIYLPNILTALKQIAPKGVVSLLKFNQLITGLGIEMTDCLKDWVIGELVIKSNSLQELTYEVIQNI